MKERLKVAVVDIFKSYCRICEALERKGHKAFFICAGKEAPRFEKTRIPISYWKRTLILPYKRIPFLHNFTNQPLVPHLLSILKRLDPHIVNVHEHSHITSSYPPTLLKERWKVVLTEHGCSWGRKRDKLLTPIAKYFLFPLVDAFVAITPAAKKFLEINGVKNVKVIGNPVDCELFTPDTRIEDRDDIILFVGRLHIFKGLKYLLLAMREVVCEIQNAKLFIIGGGPLEPLMRKLSKKYSYIRYLGPKRHEELPKYYNMAKAVVLPSIHEPFGIALAEAMACGTPVIGSNTEGIPYVIGSSGILVPPKNHKILKEAIIKVLKDSSLAKLLSIKGRKRAVRFFSYEAVAKKYEELFYEILT